MSATVVPSLDAHAETSGAPGQPTELDVHWFGQSHRLIGGRPDTRYGWLDTPHGACVVKALDLELAAYSATLLHNEREVLRHLQAAGAPVPALVTEPAALGRSDWLVTRFAGVSLQVLQRSVGEATLSVDERLTAWVHFLRQARAFDDAGALPIDLWAANLVLPLTHGLRGQVLLHRGVLIDHAHTVVAGMNLRRPVWMDRTMRRVAPELRAALHGDQEALINTFQLARTQLPGHTSLSQEAHDRTRRLWAEYDAPQQLQRTLDAGRLNRGAAMQYAVAVALEPLLALAPVDARAALQAVVNRMKADQPQARFASLVDAAEALRAVLPALPMASERHFGPLTPEDLLGPGGQSDPIKCEETFNWPPADAEHQAAAATTADLDANPLPWVATALAGEGTVVVGDPAEVLDGSSSLRPSRGLGSARRTPVRDLSTEVMTVEARPVAPVVARSAGLWLMLVAAAGAAVGVLAPLGWLAW